METTALSYLGLKQHEIEVYLVLLKEGVANAGIISAKTHLHRRTVYDTLDSLKEKGFVSFFEKDKVTFYSAISSEKLMGIYKERMNELENILPYLKGLEKKEKSLNQVRVYQGLKAIKTIFEEILEHKEYIAFGEGMKTVEFLGPFFDYFQKQKRLKKIKSRILMGAEYKKTKTVTGAFGEFRFIEEYRQPTLTYVYGKTIAIIIWSEIPSAFIIESKDAVESYKNYFNLLWKTAKR